MRVYKMDGYWHVVKNGLLLGRGPSLASIHSVLQENWA